MFSLAEARQISEPSITVQYSGLTMAQNSEEIVVMTAALDQGTNLRDEANVSVPHPPRSPVAHPVWTPQLYQARETTTFEQMEMIGDL